MRKLVAVMVTLALMLSLAACSQQTQDQEQPKQENPVSNQDQQPVEPENDASHSLVYLITTLGDMGFLDNVWEGIQRMASENGYTAQAIEMGPDASVYEAGFLDALDSGNYDVFLTVAVGGLDNLMVKYAPDYPEYKFILADVGRTFETPSDNMVAVSYRQNEGAYIGGVLAATLSQSGSVGLCLHTDSPVLNDFATGFYQGASDVNPEIKIYTAYGAGVSGDSARSAELTKIMFNNGADVVFGAAGSSNPGLFQNVIDLGGFEAGYYAIGVDYDQWYTYANSNSPEMADVIVSSVVKHGGNSINVVWDSLEKGEISWGDTMLFGLAEDSVGLAKNDYYMASTSVEVQAMIDEYEAGVKDGEIAVKSYFDFADHDEFLAYQAQFAA